MPARPPLIRRETETAKRYVRGGAAMVAFLFLVQVPLGAEAQVCTSAARARCESEEAGCLRDCSDMTRCVRRCCEARNACLVENGCEPHGLACPR